MDCVTTACFSHTIYALPRHSLSASTVCKTNTDGLIGQPDFASCFSFLTFLKLTLFYGFYPLLPLTRLEASLQWNSIEQYFFWQLINAHEIPTRSFLPLVKFVDPTKHPEACANLVLLFKLEKPSFELVRALLSRPGPNDALSITALHFWSCPDNQHASRFASILKSMIMMPLSQRLESTVNSSGATSTSGNARDPREKKRNGTKLHLSPENHVDLSLILTHLDAIRRNCKNISHGVQGGSKMCNCFLQDEDVQLALQEVMKSNKVSVAVKDHFSDLLALAEDQPSAPQINKTSNSSTANGSTADPLRRRSKAVSFPARSVPLGSKGGHSLRNLDSRRAAQAERRQIPNSSSGASTVKQGSRTSTSQNANEHAESDSSEDADAISLVSSSSDGLDEDEESERSAVTPKRNSRNSSPSGSRTSHEPIAKSVKRGGRAPADLTKERRASTKRAPIRAESVPKVDADEEEDDDDEDEEDKSLEVVVLEDDSGDEKVNEDAEQVRPPKRRKTTSRRFALDD
ncbi:hypothetical protein AHF37_05744 [Paragonimus kellicotti]|nr:hypothetical protein AHF37_05744 [Paragonimus kellicotti]